MNESFKYYTSDKFVKLSLVLSLCFIVVSSAIIILSAQNLPPYIPIFNSMPWGEDRLFFSMIVYALPVLLAIIFLTNTTLALALYKKYTLISRILSFNTLLVIILMLLAYLQIIFLVF